MSPDDPWTPLLPLSQVGKAPQRVVVGAVALVVWRAARGRPVVFLDRCPHRDVPLSTGRRTFTGRLVCDGHGWEFDAAGRIVKTDRPRDLAGLCATVVECREEAGRLWVKLPEVTGPGAASD